MLVAQHVPDEVWESLPPRRLPRWRVLGSVLLLALLGMGAYGAAQIGVLAPNVSAYTGGAGWKEGSRTFSIFTTLDNQGLVDTTIESAAVSGSWVRLDSVTLPDLAQGLPTSAPDAFPLRLGPHEGATIELRFTVTDCSAIDRSGLTVTVQATSPVRTSTLDITPSGTSDPGAPSSYSWTGSDPWNVPWPGTYAASACGVPLPPKP